MTEQKSKQFNELVMAHLDKVGAFHLKDDTFSKISHTFLLNTNVGGFRIHLPLKQSVVYIAFCKFDSPELAWVKFPFSNPQTGKYNKQVSCQVTPEQAAKIFNDHIDFVLKKSHSY